MMRGAETGDTDPIPTAYHAFKQAFTVDADVPTAIATIARDIQGVLGDRLTVPSYLFREGMAEIEE